MMVSWGFGGPIRASATPVVTAGLGLLISRNAYGSMVGAVLGGAVSCLGPQFTKWHLGSYAQQYPHLSLEGFANAWKKLHEGQGDGLQLRIDRVRPSLDSVPNGMRRWLGIAFVAMQSSASLRKLLAEAYTDSLTVSPALQSVVSQGKSLLDADRVRQETERQAELERLQTLVLQQEGTIRALQEDGAHTAVAEVTAEERLRSMEEVMARFQHALAPLLEQLARSGENGAEISLMLLRIQGKSIVEASSVHPDADAS